MAAPEPEPPAVTRSLEKEQCGGHEPGHVFPQLLAALQNPDIKALEWSQDGQDIIVDTELYEEEMGKNKDLFPELADLGSEAALQAWLLAYGFRLKGTKVKLQHPDFQRAHLTAEAPGALGGDGHLSATQQKKKKRKTPASCQRPQKGATSQDTLGRRPRLRPLYQYINLDMPELLHPSAGDSGPQVAQPSQVPAAPGTATAPQLQGTWTSSAPEIPAPEASSNMLMPIDIDRMMGYAAQQMPTFFPQYK